MHFPEEQLATYLRAFTAQDAIDGVLDAVAQAALDEGIEDEVRLFALAHRLMPADVRRTDGLEAVVLVEEVGLTTGQVAAVLDLPLAVVEAAVDEAWAEVPGQRWDEPPTGSAAEDEPADEAEPALEEEPALEGAPAVGGARAVEDTPAAEPPPRPRRAGAVGLALAVVALVALAVAVFSEAGTARLNALGVDPLAAFLVVVGLLGGGSALIRAGAEHDDERPATDGDLDGGPDDGPHDGPDGGSGGGAVAVSPAAASDGPAGP